MAWYNIVLISILSVSLWITVSCIFYKQFFKRFYDIVCSLLALIVFSPLFLLLIIVGTIAMKGNPFFTQERPGYKEKIFKLIKFRTMTNEKDENGNDLPDEVRLNKYGKFLRSTSLDELPEAINILIGDMSVIGPRPLLVKYLPYYTEEERHRHDVRPGLSGWAQVNGRNYCSWNDRFRLDIEYIENMAFFFDVKIIVLSALLALKRTNIAVGKENVIEDLNEERKQGNDDK